MGPHRLFAQLAGEGVKTTLEECIDLFRRYKETFRTTIEWLNDQKRIAHRELTMVNYAGRRRWWKAPNDGWARKAVREELEKKREGKLTEQDEWMIPRLAAEKVKGAWAKIEREAANFMVQSGNVEWLKDSMYEIRKEVKRRDLDAHFQNAVYDETVMNTSEKDAEEVHELQKRIMIREGQKYLKRVPVEVEGHLKPHWDK